MPTKALFNVLFSIFLSVFLPAATVFAQTNSCAVKMDVTGNNSKAKLTGSAANAVNTKTKKIYNSVLKSGMPYFAKLPEGVYRITVSKIGFMRSIEDFYLNCAQIQSGNYEWSIELSKGSPKQVVKLYNRPKQYTTTPVGRTEVNNDNVSENSQVGGTISPDSNEAKMAAQRAPQNVVGGIINGKATNLVKPAYPAAARAVRASGAVNVQVTIDEQGNVISASAVSGHPLLRAAAVQAARASTFSPTLLLGQPVKVTGIIVYNFVP